MPTYEYQCAKCGHVFDKYQSMSDKAIDTCPKDACPQRRWGKGKVKRVIGAGAGLIFKGSGFYITDYRSEGYKEAAKKDTAPAASSSDSKSDSKPSTPATDSKTPKAKTETPKPAKPTKSKE